VISPVELPEKVSFAPLKVYRPALLTPGWQTLAEVVQEDAKAVCDIRSMPPKIVPSKLREKFLAIVTFFLG
jgi:hypothetical protein